MPLFYAFLISSDPHPVPMQTEPYPKKTVIGPGVVFITILSVCLACIHWSHVLI